MSEPNNDRVPADFAKKAIVHAAAVESLVGAGCESCLELFTGHAEQFLRVELETGETWVADEKGAKRYGITPRQLAEEIRSEYSRFFRKRI